MVSALRPVIGRATCLLFFGVAVVARLGAAPGTGGKDQPQWAQLTQQSGEFKASASNKTFSFSPRTAAWRIHIQTEPPADKSGAKSQLKLSLWEGQLNPHGKIDYRPSDVQWRGHGQDSFDQELSNGALDDGSPRPMRLTINGSAIKYDLTVEDQGAAAAGTETQNKGNAKKK